MCASAMRASAAPVLLRTTGLLVQPIRDAIPIDCSFGAMTARELKSCCLESWYIAHHRNFIWPCQQFLHAGGEVSRIQQSETLALVDGFFFGSADLLFSLEPVVDFRAGLIAATIQKVLVKLAVNLEWRGVRRSRLHYAAGTSSTHQISANTLFRRLGRIKVSKPFATTHDPITKAASPRSLSRDGRIELRSDCPR